MRITVHTSDELTKELKEVAHTEKKSASSIAAEAVEFYIREGRERQQWKCSNFRKDENFSELIR